MNRCAGAILLKDGRILLAKRASDRELYPNAWDIVGGHCLTHEKPPQTLVRELQEEIDVTPVSFVRLAVLYEPQPDLYGEREYHVYVVTEWTGQRPTVLGDEHSEIRWFPTEEASRLELAHPGYVELFEVIQRMFP